MIVCCMFIHVCCWEFFFPCVFIDGYGKGVIHTTITTHPLFMCSSVRWSVLNRVDPLVARTGNEIPSILGWSVSKAICTRSLETQFIGAHLVGNP